MSLTAPSPSQIKIRYFAMLRETRGISDETVAIAPGELASQVYVRLAGLHGFSLSLADLRMAVNDNFVGLDHPLQDGDTLAFIPPVSGG
jgi:molybdopterin converting factor subunit 1